MAEPNSVLQSFLGLQFTTFLETEEFQRVVLVEPSIPFQSFGELKITLNEFENNKDVDLIRNHIEANPTFRFSWFNHVKKNQDLLEHIMKSQFKEADIQLALREIESSDEVAEGIVRSLNSRGGNNLNLEDMVDKLEDMVDKLDASDTNKTAIKSLLNAKLNKGSSKKRLIMMAEVEEGEEPSEAPSGTKMTSVLSSDADIDIERAFEQLEREVWNKASSAGTAMTSVASALVHTRFKIEEAIPSLEIVHKKRLKKDREYTGSVLIGAAHGCGCMMYDDGRIASGNFLNGVLHGHACLIFGDGSMYFGNFWKHKREGKGTYIYQDGSNYVGDFSRDKRHGRGRYVSKENNKTYDGQFKDGKFEGYGFVLGVNGELEEAGRFEDWELVEDMKAANQDPKVAVQNLIFAEEKKAFEEQEAAKSPNELVVESWAAVTKIPGYQIVAGKILFRRIFELNGDALALFSFGKNYKPDDDALYKDPIFTEHSTAVVSSVATAVNLLERGDINGLISELKELGDQYAQFNFTKADYDLVRDSFLYALEKALGDAFTPRVKQSWVGVYDVISQLLGLVPQRPSKLLNFFNRQDENQNENTNILPRISLEL